MVPAAATTAFVDGVEPLLQATSAPIAIARVTTPKVLFCNVIADWIFMMYPYRDD